MNESTSALKGAPNPRTFQFRAASDGHRVIYHEPICPACGSSEVIEHEVGTGDGITEIALTCTACGTAWPVACVVDWDSPHQGGGDHATP